MYGFTGLGLSSKIGQVEVQEFGEFLLRQYTPGIVFAGLQSFHHLVANRGIRVAIECI